MPIIGKYSYGICKYDVALQTHEEFMVAMGQQAAIEWAERLNLEAAMNPEMNTIRYTVFKYTH